MSGEHIVIEQTFPDNGVRSPQYKALVRKTGLRTLVAEQIADQSSDTEPTALPSLNTNVVASFFRNETMYSFESVIQEYNWKLEGGTTIVLRRPKRVVKVQRRFSYRVPVETRTTYSIFWPESCVTNAVPAKIVNISEGGMLIATNGRIQAGSLLKISVPSGIDAEYMEVNAEVLQVTDDFNLTQETTVARLRFDGPGQVELTDDQRKRLVRYLFEQQRLMLQARRLLNPAKKGL